MFKILKGGVGVVQGIVWTIGLINFLYINILDGELVIHIIKLKQTSYSNTLKNSAKVKIKGGGSIFLLYTGVGVFRF